jgi:hypothetical protein
MARTIKIPCEGVIYTVHRDEYGGVTEAAPDVVEAEPPPYSDEAMDEEQARYAQILHELTEFEEAIARAEADQMLAQDIDD